MWFFAVIIGIAIFVFILKFAFAMWKLSLGILLIVILLMLFAADEVGAHEYSPMDIVNMGKVVHHEAGNQSEYGKRLVADTILNRVESGDFPNTVDGVLDQPGQYCRPKEFPPRDMYRIVAEEIFMRTNKQVLWYRTGKYHTYGIPLLKEGNHYFSGDM